MDIRSHQSEVSDLSGCQGMGGFEGKQRIGFHKRMKLLIKITFVFSVLFVFWVVSIDGVIEEFRIGKVGNVLSFLFYWWPIGFCVGLLFGGFFHFLSKWILIQSEVILRRFFLFFLYAVVLFKIFSRGMITDRTEAIITVCIIIIIAVFHYGINWIFPSKRQTI